MKNRPPQTREQRRRASLLSLTPDRLELDNRAALDLARSLERPPETENREWRPYMRFGLTVEECAALAASWTALIGKDGFTSEMDAYLERRRRAREEILAAFESAKPDEMCLVVDSLSQPGDTP